MSLSLSFAVRQYPSHLFALSSNAFTTLCCLKSLIQSRSYLQTFFSHTHRSLFVDCYDLNGTRPTSSHSAQSYPNRYSNHECCHCDIDREYSLSSFSVPYCYSSESRQFANNDLSDRSKRRRDQRHTTVSYANTNNIEKR